VDVHQNEKKTAGMIVFSRGVEKKIGYSQKICRTKRCARRLRRAKCAGRSQETPAFSYNKPKKPKGQRQVPGARGEKSLAAGYRRGKELAPSSSISQEAEKKSPKANMEHAM